MASYLSCLSLGGVASNKHCKNCSASHVHTPLETELRTFLDEEGISKELTAAFLRQHVFTGREKGSDFTKQSSVRRGCRDFHFRVNLQHLLLQVAFLRSKGRWQSDNESFINEFAADIHHLRRFLSGSGAVDGEIAQQLVAFAADRLRSFLEEQWITDWLSLVRNHGLSAKLQHGGPAVPSVPAGGGNVAQDSFKGDMGSVMLLHWVVGIQGFPLDDLVGCVAQAAGVYAGALQAGMAKLQGGFLGQLVNDSGKTSPAWKALICGERRGEAPPVSEVGFCSALRLAAVALGRMQPHVRALYLLEPAMGAMWVYPSCDSPFLVEMPISRAVPGGQRMVLYKGGCEMGGFRLSLDNDPLPNGLVDNSAILICHFASTGLYYPMSRQQKPAGVAHAPGAQACPILADVLVRPVAPREAAPLFPLPPDPSGTPALPDGQLELQQQRRQQLVRDQAELSGDDVPDCDSDGRALPSPPPVTRKRGRGRPDEGPSRAAEQRRSGSSRGRGAAAVSGARGRARGAAAVSGARGRGRGAAVVSPRRRPVLQRLQSPPTYLAVKPEEPLTSNEVIKKLYPFKEVGHGSWAFVAPSAKAMRDALVVLKRLTVAASGHGDVQAAQRSVCYLLGVDFGVASSGSHCKSSLTWDDRFSVNVVSRLAVMQADTKSTFGLYWPNRCMDVIKDFMEYSDAYTPTPQEIEAYGNGSYVITAAKVVVFIRRLTAGAVQRANFGRTKEGRELRAAAVAAAAAEDAAAAEEASGASDREGSDNEEDGATTRKGLNYYDCRLWVNAMGWFQELQHVLIKGKPIEEEDRIMRDPHVKVLTGEVREGENKRHREERTDPGTRPDIPTDDQNKLMVDDWAGPIRADDKAAWLGFRAAFEHQISASTFTRGCTVRDLHYNSLSCQVYEGSPLSMIPSQPMYVVVFTTTSAKTGGLGLRRGSRVGKEACEAGGSGIVV
ncbi:hypothetical protein Agub_g4120 [Astrephomene gubernaculifera]|uniref:Uncharacterized protein n=1 Tax=Astrephomene gubernaculifera TaxID=47775 RepID=A0AAD3DM45_9CHLO|nr:hypothetical protein Agub_g4120 [Astrephomene gubernaculifera]